jgi:signal transduction histidine kinase
MISPMVDTFRDFFDLNSALVFFVYGQVFFVLGLAILLQSRRHSRLSLARSLRWLGVFGISHGLHEWGTFFIPIQSAYMSYSVLTILQIVQVVLLGFSFFFLFQFGAELLSERWSLLYSVPVIITAILSVTLIVIALEGRPGLGTWQQQASICLRYLVGFPGSILAALGLRHHAKHHIKPLNLSHIYRMLRIAGISMIFYGTFTGLVVPAGNFFPANWLNDSLPVTWLGIPIPVFRSVAGLVLAVTIIRALEVFDLEIDERLEMLEIEQSLVAERERIGRELHDGAIQQVYTAGLIIESAQRKIEAESSVAEKLERAVIVLDQAITSLRAYMKELRQEATPVSLVDGLKQQADDPRFKSLMDIDFHSELPLDLALEPVETTHILAISGEALSNAARHAQARKVEIRANLEDDFLLITIKDNGRGFREEGSERGYGLRNMRDRARLLGGELEIASSSGNGTTIKLIVPWRMDERNNQRHSG